ncbi:MAG TPA: endonuclease NucS domain-containing protein, partial [Thermoplasmata archaeon]|nr:endonuclease NucS domain-containing protein [Thermoplasmata archaeon]
WNLSIRGEQYKEIRVFPYAILIEVLLNISEGITAEEYNLFVCRSETEDSANRVCEQIRRWRRLDEKAQGRIVHYLDSVPTQSAHTDDGVSLYTRISRCQPYAWALFSSSGRFIERTRQSLRIEEGKSDPARQRLTQHHQTATFIRFENEKEWFSYYGDIGVENSYNTAMTIYEARYDVPRAVEALQAARSRALVDAALTDESYVQTLVHEKVIEDILEHRLTLLEPGLTLHAEGDATGRQFQTERGIIDLLARDPQGNWVVIELKRERAGDKVMGQTLRYIGWVKDNRREASQVVRGIIVGKQIDRNLISAARGVDPLPIRLCEFDFRLRVETKYPPPVVATS